MTFSANKISCLNFWNEAWWFLSLRVFQTIVFIFIVISMTFWPICPPAFFRCLSNSGTFTELRTTSFIESRGVACSDYDSHNRVQVLSIPVLLLACSQDWTCNLQMVASLIGNGGYCKVKKDLTLKTKRKQLQIIGKNKDLIPQTKYRQQIQHYSKLPHIYGLPKIHKDGIPLTHCQQPRFSMSPIEPLPCGDHRPTNW